MPNRIVNINTADSAAMTDPVRWRPDEEGLAKQILKLAHQLNPTAHVVAGAQIEALIRAVQVAVRQQQCRQVVGVKYQEVAVIAASNQRPDKQRREAAARIA